MSLEKFGIKELYEATLKASFDITIGSRKFEKGEPVLEFKNLSFASIAEGTGIVTARGGRGNPTRVVWEQSSDTLVSLKEGVLSRDSFAMLINADVLPSEETIDVPKNENIVFSDAGTYQVNSKISNTKPFFLYITEDGVKEKIESDKFTITDGLLEYASGANQTARINYYSEYEDGYKRFLLNKERFNGVFRFEGKAYYKTEDSGLLGTAIIVAPRVKLISNLQLFLGEKADPLVSTFNMIAIYEKDSKLGKETVIDIQFLDTDIDSDI